MAGSITSITGLPPPDELELEEEELELEEDELELDEEELELDELELLVELLEEELELDEISSPPHALSSAAELTSIKLLIIRRLKQRKGVLSNMLFSTHCNYWRSSN